ncbi:hypothetical protein [Halorussus sp. MSC15.2]|uniref:hypothetical protein n=1 Tax=Halorussus sp. MSC15.2 TaxID=2283638 RepID=UPI0013D395B8|nr:hypothetical protein [Halorussus sp. MSC15.2]NEU55667.1 hypothetical protein [Halorussus sp. MSC15.2]
MPYDRGTEFGRGRSVVSSLLGPPCETDDRPPVTDAGIVVPRRSSSDSPRS